MSAEPELLPAGREANGRFAKGNPGGPGNPGASRVHELRAALLSAVTAVDVRKIVKKLVELAKDGNLDAAGLLFDRVFGKAPQALAIAEVTEDVSGGGGRHGVRVVTREDFFGDSKAHDLQRERELTLADRSPEERREKLKEIAERFGVALDSPQELIQAAMQEPGYLDYLREQSASEG